MAGPAIANPTIILSTDNAPLDQGLKNATKSVNNFGKNISSGLKTYFSGVASAAADIGKKVGTGGGFIGKSVSNVITGSIKSMAVLNQALEFGNKVKAVFGSPFRAAMATEARQAQFVGMGTPDEFSFTGIMSNFQNTVEDTFSEIANSLDSIFNIKSGLEWFRGSIAAIGAIFTGLASEFGNQKINPKDLGQAFKDGANATITAFEVAAKIAVQITNSFIRILNALDAKSKIMGLQNVVAGGLAGVGEFIGVLPRGVGKFLQEDIARGEAARRNAKFAEIEEAKIGRIAQGARNAINNANNQNEQERKAIATRDRIAGSLGIDVQSRIGGFLTMGSSGLEEALVKARLQAEGGDIQMRIEQAILQQIEIDKAQVNVLNAIKTVLQNKPALNVLGG
jgi:hypothetical protein